jgi:hypothetical protein
MWGGQQHGNYQKSNHFGGQGGGTAEFAQPNLSLVAVRGRCGAALDQIQFLFVDINSGQYVESPRWGGTGGGEFIYQAPPGQWIDNIEVNSDNFIQGIQFTTNQGDRSKKFGGNAGSRGTFHVQGKRITGVFCRYGALVDGLQFYAAA